MEASPKHELRRGTITSISQTVMEAGHSHAIPEGANERSLWVALILTFGFLVVEVIGGLVTGSLALISDAAHMFTDAAALAIALAAVRVSRRPADSRRTFGYYPF